MGDKQYKRNISIIENLIAVVKNWNVKTGKLRPKNKEFRTAGKRIKEMSINHRVSDICGVKQGCDRLESWDEEKTVKHDCHSSAPSASFVWAFFILFFIFVSFFFWFRFCCSTSFVWVFFHCRDIISAVSGNIVSKRDNSCICSKLPTQKLRNNIHCQCILMCTADRD